METLASDDLLSAVVEEMKLSQLLRHPNIACYYGSFVVGTKLWAVQPLMHYGECLYCDLCAPLQWSCAPLQ